MHKHFKGYHWNKRVDEKEQRAKRKRDVKAGVATNHLDSLSSKNFNPKFF